MVLKIAHDFNCPWCWIGWHQTRDLKAEFGVDFDWIAAELYPDHLEFNDYPAEKPANPDRPVVPSRFELAMAAQRLPKLPAHRPHNMRTHNCHEAVEYAKSLGDPEPLIGRLYEAYWREGKNINDPDQIVALAPEFDETELRAVMAERRFDANIIKFDDDAYAAGIYNVPTLWVGNRRYAEQPITVLQLAVSRAMPK